MDLAEVDEHPGGRRIERISCGTATEQYDFLSESYRFPTVEVGVFAAKLGAVGHEGASVSRTPQPPTSLRDYPGLFPFMPNDSLSSDACMALAFEMAPVGLCISEQRVIRRCNPKFASLFGYAVAEIEGRSFEMLYPSPAEFERIGELSRERMRTTGQYADDRLMRHKNGQLSWFRAVGQSMDPEVPFAVTVWTFQPLEAMRPAAVELTARERDVASLVVTGASAKTIARSLGLSPRTVEHYRTKLINKHDVRTTSELISRLAGPGR